MQRRRASPATSEIPITSIREDNHGHSHTGISFKDDRITLTHPSFRPRGFAIGAIMAAQWLLGHKGIFNMNDLLKNHPTIRLITNLNPPITHPPF